MMPMSPKFYFQAWKRFLPVCCVTLWMVCSLQAALPVVQILDRPTYLGVAGFPEWEHFRNVPVSGRELNLDFEWKGATGAATLSLLQEDVKHPWSVSLNGKTLGKLTTGEFRMREYLEIPAGLLLPGSNQLSIRPPKVVDDIVIHEIGIRETTPEQWMGEARLNFQVLLGGRPGPCRITLTEPGGAWVPCRALPVEGSSVSPAVRTGVLYVNQGRASIRLPAGKYLVHASRGPEWGVDQVEVDCPHGSVQDLQLSLEREVDTRGWVAVDTHIHNRTFSGHGDATLDESMLTIAGEGIELAVATDHNHHTEMKPAAHRMEVDAHFTPMMGNEVTTRWGHYNAYPVAPGSELPDSSLSEAWSLFESIRSRTGASIIQLNHPRNVHSGFSPTSPDNFRALTGENLREGRPFEFDAMEILTSAALQSDLMRPVKDWFALLNHGLPVVGVGSSDTHDVSRMILGQGRTYVRMEDSVPSRISQDAFVEAMRQGRATVSFGLWVNLEVKGKEAVGSLSTATGGIVELEAVVSGASWVRADRLEVFVNGTSALVKDLGPIPDGAFRLRQPLRVPIPSHDAWLVVVASGPGVNEPFWAMPRPYQPTSLIWTPKVLGITNPLWLDGDGDGRYTSPRSLASELIQRSEGNAARLADGLNGMDDSVLLQALSLLHGEGRDLDHLRPHLSESSLHSWNRFQESLALEGKAKP